ncbi:MAG: hypothetical protein SGILL_010139, partial [Bacillariaceae sp.]
MNNPAAAPAPTITIKRGVSRLAIDVGGVISVRVDTDHSSNLLETTAQKLEKITPSLECVEAVRRLVELFGAENTFILSKCSRPTQFATVAYLSRSIEGGPSFFDSTGILPHNVLFCTRRSGGGPGKDSEVKMENLVAETASDSYNASGVARTAVGDVGKGLIARYFQLTHFIDDREECLLSDMFEGHLAQPNVKVDGALIHFGPGHAMPKRQNVEKFLDDHKFTISAKLPTNAIDNALDKLTLARDWADVLRLFGIDAPQSTRTRLTPKVPREWNDLSSDQKRVYNELVEIINQPYSVVDQKYNAIPDSLGGRMI